MLARLRAEGLDDVPVVVGGIIPTDDAPTLLAAGVARVFTPKDYQLAKVMAEIVTLLEETDPVLPATGLSARSVLAARLPTGGRLSRAFSPTTLESRLDDAGSDSGSRLRPFWPVSRREICVVGDGRAGRGDRLRACACPGAGGAPGSPGVQQCPRPRRSRRGGQRSRADSGAFCRREPAARHGICTFWWKSRSLRRSRRRMR